MTPTTEELKSLIDACERCECLFDCYCASNIEWAERKLVELERDSALSSHERNSP
jgi:hypothetical protein